MDDLIGKKIILSLLDSESKSANEIADEIDESLTTVEDQLTELVSESICEEVNQEEVNKFVVSKDIETFAKLVKEFLSNKDEHKEQIEQFITKEFLSNKDEYKEQIEQFITSDYYFTRIDNELVNYVLKRFFFIHFT